jgi:DNA-binding NarL/FixJ family response regulator
LEKDMITILLVDDQPAVRQGLSMRLALEPDLEVIGEAVDGVEALRRAHELHPDVVVMDIEMPRLDGIAATEALRTIEPGCCVVILTVHESSATRARARDAGAAAFVSKHAGEEALLAAIRSATGLANISQIGR